MAATSTFHEAFIAADKKLSALADGGINRDAADGSSEDENEELAVAVPAKRTGGAKAKARRR